MQDGVNVASKWRIDGLFWTWALKKRGQVFTRVGLLVDLYSVVGLLVNPFCAMVDHARN